MENNNQDSDNDNSLVLLAVIIVAIVLVITVSCSNGNSSSPDTAKCEVCGKTYTNSDDVSSIAWNNMCERCYENFKFTQELKDEIVKYNERYGD